MRSFALLLGLAGCGETQPPIDASLDSPAADSPIVDSPIADSPGDGSGCAQGGVSFLCGTSTCTSAAPVCCQYTNMGSKCIAKGLTCMVEGGVPLTQTTQCDDTDDCGGVGHMCCRVFNKGTSMTDFLCDSCGAPGAVQICKQTCECPSGKVCGGGTCN